MFEQVVFTDHSLFGFADMASILMNKVGTSFAQSPPDVAHGQMVTSSALHDG